MTVFF